MENRKPQPAPVASRRRRPLPWILALGCLILVAFVVVLQWPTRPSARGTGTPLAGDRTVGQPQPTAQAAAPETTQQPQGAMIIDDPAAAEETRSALESLPSSDGTAPTADARVASASRSSRRARRATPRQALRPAKAAETDLLSTLMRIIQQDESAAKGKSAQSSPMDALVAQIEAEDNRNRSENQAALASLDGDRATPARSPDVQAQLRACPRANTVDGIECRRRVCADHAGDAACPRQ